MSIADLTDRKPKPLGCKLCWLLADLDKDKADQLAQAIDNPHVGSSEIARELRTDPDYLFDIGESSVRRHREPGHAR